MSIKTVLLLFIALLLVGCIIEDNTDLTKEKLKESENQLNIGLQKYEEGGTAYNNEKFVEARQRFSEAKAYFTTAKVRYNEACSLSSEICSADVIKSIDECLLPLVDLSTALTYLTEDINSQCNDYGCSETVRSKCIDLLAASKNADAGCKQLSFDAKTADSVQDVCNVVFPS